MSRASCFQIEFLLHCHYSPEEFPQLSTPTVDAVVRKFLQNELIIRADVPPHRGIIYELTPRGNAWLEAILNTPVPAQAPIEEVDPVAVKQINGYRSYAVHGGGGPEHIVSGGYSFGAYDAAKKYAGIHLPDYEVLRVCREAEPGVWRFEAINNGRQLGALIWVQVL